MFPTPYTLTVRRWLPDGVPNPHGYVEAAYGDPETFKAHAIAPGSMPEAETTSAGRDMSEILWTVYAPAGTSIHSKDLVTFNGTEYEVDGDPRDYGYSPFSNSVGGVTIALKKQEG